MFGKFYSEKNLHLVYLEGLDYSQRALVLALIFQAAICVQKRKTIYEEYTPVRLVGGNRPWEGRVEIAHKGVYGTLCHDSYFGTEEAEVLCRMMGYATNGAAHTVSPVSRNGTVWLDYLRCSGKESDIEECPSNGWNNTHCSSNIDAWITCPVTPVKLMNGASHSEGRLEVFHGGSWGSVCSNGWDRKSADVICKMLGLNDTSGHMYHNAYFGPGNGSIMIHNISCTGFESDIGACRVTWQSGSLCTHDMDIGISCRVKSGTLRIIGPTDYEGRIEIFHNGTWGTICDDTWDVSDARVVCRELGFTGNDVQSYQTYGGGQGQIWLDGTDCSGDEKSLLECKLTAWGQHDCSHGEDAGVKCVPSVRLVGANSHEGRLEIMHDGIWGTVCDDNFGANEGVVACRMLGFAGFLRTQSSVAGSGPIWLDDLSCMNNILSLDLCKHVGWNKSDCSHSEDVTIECVKSGTLRIIGPTDYEGRIEIFHNETWGTICDDTWDVSDARVVCRELGFTGNDVQSYQTYGGGQGQIWLDGTDCSGDEKSLLECKLTAWGQHDCSHGEDAGVKCVPSVRLVGANSHEGRLEIMHDGIWGTVCDDSFGANEGAVACRMLGFPGFLRTQSSVAGSGPIWLDDLSCMNNILSLDLCKHVGWNKSDCSHSEDVTIECATVSGSAKNTSSNVRLVGHSANSGRLEVFHDGEWGTVCDDGFETAEAKVACNMLGYTGFAASRYTAGGGSGRIWLDDVKCSGYESSIGLCSHLLWGNNNCGHSEDVGVVCSVPSVRLVGANSHEGRLEIMHDGIWGTVCDDNFGANEGAVACRMLGFPGFLRTQSSVAGSGPIWLDDLSCMNNILSLDLCKHVGWNKSDCSHSEDVTIECATASSNVRLVGHSANSGRLEVFHDGEWGTVCDDGFETAEAEVACNMLGYTGFAASSYTAGGGSGRIWLDDVKCSGFESSIGLCSHLLWGNNNCGHSEDVGVVCTGELIPPNEERFRLVGPTENAGRIEVFHDGQWGTICDNSFTAPEGQVACRMFGFSRLISTGRSYGAAKTTRNIFLDGLNCVGNESSLLECGHSAWGVNSCGHNEDVGVHCGNVEMEMYGFQPSLEGSSQENEGRLMMSHNGTQLYVCVNAMTLTTAETVCKLLGFDTSNNLYKAITDGRYGTVSGNPVISSITCQGNEATMDECDIETSTTCSSGFSSALGLSCLESSVHLVDGPGKWSGRLEVGINGTYGTVCNRYFDNNEATVVCKMLYKNSVVPVSGISMSSTFPKGKLPVKLGYLNCNGNEDDLAICPASYTSEYIKKNCDHSLDAGVQCKAHVPVRLTGGHNSSEGRVEIALHGSWKSACSITKNDAKVICRMLGFWYSDPMVYGSSFFGSGSGPDIVAHLNCDGSEPDIGICQWINTSSTCNRDMGIACHTANLSSTNIRLVGDHLPWKGIVQIRPNGVWGSLYYYNTYQNALRPVCRTLGFRWMGSPLYYEGINTGFHVLQQMSCDGSELNIGQCVSSGDYYPTSSQYSLNVDCIGNSQLVRLMGGSNPLEGRVEILYNGKWGTVCDNGWGSSDTSVLCRSLGFESTTTNYYYSAYFGQGTGPIHFANMNCYGSEYHIAQCDSINGSSCSHSEDIGVRCSNCIYTFNNETGSATSSSSYSQRDCYYIIKPGYGKYKLNITMTQTYSGYPSSVQVRDGPTGKFLGQYNNTDKGVVAGTEFWVHFKTDQPSYNTVHLTWSPLHLEDVIEVGCTHKNWNVSVNVTNLSVLQYSSQSYIFLGECQSPSWFDDGTLYLKPPLSDCNTQKEVSNGIVTYSNTLAYREGTGIILTNERWNIRIKCRLSSEQSSHIQLKPIDGTVTSTVQSVITGSGRPETTVAMYIDPTYYRQPVIDGMRIKIGQTVYVKVTLSSANSNDKMVVQDCYAKPKEDASQSETYKLIDNGCVVDPNTQVDTMVDTETRFHFNMFSFLGDRSTVFVYCDTSYCDKGDPSVVCQHGCRSAGRRSVHEKRPGGTVKLPVIIAV